MEPMSRRDSWATLPKQPLSYSSIMGISTISALIPLAFLTTFSGMGFGLDIVILSHDYKETIMFVIQMVLGFCFIMYLFDAKYWPLPIQVICVAVISSAIIISLCVLVAEVPYGPICVFTVMTPLSIFGIKNTCFDHVRPNVFVGWYFIIYNSLGGIILGAFFYWCSISGNMWDSTTNAQYSHKAGCPLNFDGLEECKSINSDRPCFFDEDYQVVSFSASCSSRCLDVYSDCQEAFIVWSFPGLAALALIVMGFISKYLEDPADPHNTRHFSVIAKFCAVFLFIFWIYASLSGAGEGLSSSLIAFAISMFIGSAIVMSIVFWNFLMEQESFAILDKVRKQIDEYIYIVRGLFALAFSPLSLVYILLSMINQFIRRSITRHCLKGRMPDAEYEHNGWFTFAVARQINYVLSWDHARVITYAVYWGIGYVFLNVLASKLTTVFLSWLIEYTSSMNLFVVTGIVIAVGMVLFMLPPVPGLPIYLTGGIVLVSVGQATLGLWGSIGYACFVSLFLKLLACAVQQQLIGAPFGRCITIKQMVAINSEGIRAMRVMLSDKGITARKVAVLVGGPDWPVSVLCGILGLDLFPILFGTLPVVVLIVPTVLCGSFAYMGSLQDGNGFDLYPWADTMGAVASALAAGSLFYFALSAAAAVKDTLENEKDAINAIPLDEDVRAADEASILINDAYRSVTIWSNVPFVMKSILVLSLLLMMGCCYLLVIFNSQCLQEYDLMYSIREHLGGSWMNVVLPLGRIALILFVISTIFLFIFQKWASRKAGELITKQDAETTLKNSPAVGKEP